MKKLIISVAVMLTLSNTAFATFLSVEEMNSKTFHCTASDPTATIDIQVHALKGAGLCSGPYVTAPGRLMGIPATVLNTSYFDIDMSIKKPGEIEMIASTGELTCADGTGDNRNLWGSAEKICEVN